MVLSNIIFYLLQDGCKFLHARLNQKSSLGASCCHRPGACRGRQADASSPCCTSRASLNDTIAFIVIFIVIILLLSSTIYKIEPERERGRVNEAPGPAAAGPALEQREGWITFLGSPSSGRRRASRDIAPNQFGPSAGRWRTESSAPTAWCAELVRGHIISR